MFKCFKTLNDRFVSFYEKNHLINDFKNILKAIKCYQKCYQKCYANSRDEF